MLNAKGGVGEFEGRAVVGEGGGEVGGGLDLQGELHGVALSLDHHAAEVEFHDGVAGEESVAGGVG